MTSKEALENLGRVNLGDNPYCIFEDNLLKNCCKEEYEAVEKDLEILEEYRKIEKELGIDLITLFKAKKEGIYYKTINHNIYYISKKCLCIEFNYEWELWVENHSILEGLLIHLKDYGKTWALTREELSYEEI